MSKKIDEVKVMLDDNNENVVLIDGDESHTYDLTGNTVGIKVQGKHLTIGEPLPVTSDEVKFKVTDNMNLSLESFTFPGDYEEHALVIGIDDLRTGRTISAFSIDDRTINVHRENGYLVIGTGEIDDDDTDTEMM